jgi:hypothetical protein
MKDLFCKVAFFLFNSAGYELEDVEKQARNREHVANKTRVSFFPQRRLPSICTPREQCLLKTLCCLSILLLVSFIAITYLAGETSFRFTSDHSSNQC